MPVLSNAAVKLAASAAGFDLCGVSAAARHPKLERLAAWLAEGRAGEMGYLERSLDERLDPAVLLPTARSVVSVACVYNSSEARDAAGPGTPAPPIARYARGDDYHDVFRDRLRALLRWMAAEAPGLEGFTCVDDGPMQERVFAEQAGIGWIGKNTCVINPKLGSWLVLGEIITNAEIAVDLPAVDQCGTCTRCLEACPTGAFTEAWSLDATKCLSYLTIELRGDVAPELRPAIREQIVGCDICQDVCPWNRRAAVTEDPVWATRDALMGASVSRLCATDDETWRSWLRGSAMRRAGLPRVRRSLAYAAAHLPLADAHAALDALAAHPSAGDTHVAAAIAWSRAVLAAGPSTRPA